MYIDFSNPLWFKDAINSSEHITRKSEVSTIQKYLLREHKINGRHDTKYKSGDKVTNAKILSNILNTFITFHSSYLIGNPISLTGNDNIVKIYNNVYKKGLYSGIDYQVCKELYTYANCFEYVYFDDTTNKIKSKIIDNLDSYPIYDESGEYVAFIQHWDALEYAATLQTEYLQPNDIVYYPDHIDSFKNNELVSTMVNKSGLPIHYRTLNRNKYKFFGDSPLNNLISKVDDIEFLLSKMNDAVYRLSLNPIAKQKGAPLKDGSMSVEDTGSVIHLGLDGDDFEYVTATCDYNTLKILIDELNKSLYTEAGVPSSVFGQTNEANVSETSLKLLFNQADNIAKETIQSLREGFMTRWEYIRKILKSEKNIAVSDDDFDSLDCRFITSRPVDEKEHMEYMQMQRKMGALSIKTILDNSSIVTDTSLELKRLKEEKQSANGSEGTETGQNKIGAESERLGNE